MTKWELLRDSLELNLKMMPAPEEPFVPSSEAEAAIYTAGHQDAIKKILMVMEMFDASPKWR